MKIETVYNDLQRHIKESAGMPAYYYDLSVEQRFFVEDFYSAIVFPDTSEEVKEVKDLLKELDTATDALISRYAGR